MATVMTIWFGIICRLAKEINGPLNILAAPCVLPAAELTKMGMARLIVGGALMRATLTLLKTLVEGVAVQPITVRRKHQSHMRRRKYRQKPTSLPVYGPLGPEDGVDPRTETWNRPRPVHNRKALQLCNQIAETLHGVLQGECGDDVLRDLLVQSVEPAPDSTHVVVTVSLSPAALERTPVEVLEHLLQAYGAVRSQVAAAIHRRKTPELMFRVAGRWTG